MECEKNFFVETRVYGIALIARLAKYYESMACSDPCSRCVPGSISRRTFWGVLISFVGLGSLPSRLFAQTIAIRLDLVPSLKRIGGWTIIEIKGKPVLLVRDSESTVRATHAICTHKKAKLKFNAKKSAIECPNHGSLYNFAGEVLKGPSKKPLMVYQAKLDRDTNRILLTLS